MKHGQNSRRGRSRGGGKRSQPSRNQTFDSNGPEGKVRGTPQQIYDKYQSLARDAASAGEHITAEGFYQFAEHYYRILSADQQNRQRAEQQQQQQQQDAEDAAEEAGESGDDGAQNDAKGNDDAGGTNDGDDNRRGRGNGKRRSAGGQKQREDNAAAQGDDNGGQSSASKADGDGAVDEVAKEAGADSPDSSEPAVSA